MTFAALALWINWIVVWFPSMDWCVYPHLVGLYLSSGMDGEWRWINYTTVGSVYSCAPETALKSDGWKSVDFQKHISRCDVPRLPQRCRRMTSTALPTGTAPRRLLYHCPVLMEQCVFTDDTYNYSGDNTSISVIDSLVVIWVLVILEHSLVIQSGYKVLVNFTLPKYLAMAKKLQEPLV